MDEDVQQKLQYRRYSEAFELLLDRYQEKVFRLAISILRDADRAEEVTQDAFLKFWRALPAYDGRAAPSTWLYAIARNTCLSAAKSKACRPTRPLAESETPRRSEDLSRHAEVTQLVDRLPEAQRQAITLYYFEHLLLREIGEVMGLSDSRVCQLHQSALARLRDAMSEELVGSAEAV